MTAAATRREGSDQVRAESRRRRPTLRRLLAVALVGVAVLSVAVLGVFSYLVARNVLTDAATAQLDNHQAGQVRAIRNGIARIEDELATVARGQATVDALRGFSAAYDDLGTQPDLLSSREAAAVARFYDEQAGDGPTPAWLATADEATRYLQYHYVVTNPAPPERRDEVADAPADATAYGRLHADVHPRLVALQDTLGFDDLLLVTDDGRIVYTAQKRTEFATTVTDGPARGTGLADAITDKLTRAAINETVLVDLEPYPPADGRPTMFAAATVSDGAEVIGAVVAEVSVSALNALTTNGREWEQNGLGETGEVYVVGADRRMRSDARLWLEDPQAYLDAVAQAGYPERLGATIAAADTTATLQPAATAPVDAAFEGRRFVDRTDNYLDRSTISVAGPLGTADLDWVVVAEIATAEADAPVAALLRRLLVTAGVLIPLVIVAGFLLADRIARPVRPVVAGAAAMAAGDLEARVEDLGRTEVGDVGRRLNDIAADLRAQRAARVEEERGLSELLRAVLPGRLVDRLGPDTLDVADLTDTATIIALTVHGPLERSDLDSTAAVELSAQLSRELEQTAERFGIERVRSASEHHLFAAGLGSPDAAADRAASFVTHVRTVCARIAQETGVDVHHHAGLCAGDVVAAMVHPDTLTYGVFGAPVRTALALDAVAVDGQALVHASVAVDLGADWELTPAEGVVDLRGEEVEATVLVGPVADDHHSARWV